MEKGLGILNYQPQTGAGLRWGRIIAAAALLLATSILVLVAQAAYLFTNFAGITNSATAYVLLTAVPTFLSACAIVIGGVLLATAHHAPPRGAGLSIARQAGMLLTFAYLADITVSVAMNVWAANSPASPPEYLIVARSTFLVSIALWFALLVALCLYTHHISQLIGRNGLFLLTLFCAGLSGLTRLAATGIVLVLWFNPSFYLSSALLRFANPALGIASASLNVIYWPALLFIAWSSSRRERRGEGA